MLGGVCALTPVVIERWGRLAGRFTGSTRLALRSLDRNRARSAAIVAAIVAVVAGGVAGASSVERWHPEAGVYDPGATRLDVVRITSGNIRGVSETGLAPTTTPVPAAERAAVEAVVGPTQWHELRFVRRPEGGVDLVVDRALLTTLGLPATAIDRVLAAGPSLLSREPFSGVGVLTVPQLVIPLALVVPADVATREGLTPVGTGALGFTQRPITAEQRLQLLHLQNVADLSASLFDGPSTHADDAVYNTAVEYPATTIAVTRTMARWFLIAGLLLLVTLIIAAGLVLWAVEGRTERDQLVALGASPQALARVAALRAWVLSATGAVIAVPVGLGALWAVMHALDRPVPIPVATVLMLVVALPLLAAGVSFAGSLVAQIVRPATGTTLSLD